MKKVLYLITIMLASAVFMRAYWLNDYFQSQAAESPRNKVFEQSSTPSLLFFTETGMPADDSARQEFLNLMEKYDASVTMAYSGTRSDGRQFQVSFVLNSEANPVFSFETLEGTDVSFSADCSDYLSTDTGDTGRAGTIGFTNKEHYADYSVIYEMKPLSWYWQEAAGNCLSLTLFAQDTEGLLNEFEKSTFGSIYTYYDPGEYDRSYITNESFLNTVLTFSIVTLIIVYLIVLYRHIRQIMIQKMLGNSPGRIFTTIVLKDLAVLLVLFAAWNLILYLIMAGNFSAVHYRLQRELVKGCLLFLAGILVTGLAAFLFIQMQRGTKQLKNGLNRGIFSVFGMVLKVAFLFAMIPFLSESFVQTSEDIDEYITLFVSNTDQTEMTALALGSPDFDNETFGQMISDQNWLYILEDFYYRTENYDGDVLELMDDYWYMKNAPSKITVNPAMANYLKIKDPEGNVLTFDNSQSFLLIPEGFDYYDENTADRDEQTAKITIETGRRYYNPGLYDLSLGAPVSWKDPVIYVATEIWECMSGGSFDTWYYPSTDLDAMREVYKQYGLGEPAMAFTSDLNAREQNQLWMDILKDLFMTLLIVILILMFEYQSIFLFLEENQNLLAVQTIMGKTMLQKYKYLLVGNLLINILPLAIWFGFFKTDLAFFWLLFAVILVLDIIVCLAAIRHFEKKRVTPVLKGEDL